MFLAVATVFCSLSNGANAQARFLQKQTQFRAALENQSTSPSFVLVTVVDGRSRAETTGCVFAPFLLGAIAKEKGITRTEALAEALARKDHIFTFSSPEALANLSLNESRYSPACAIIRSGEPAYMQDRTGQIRAGQP